MRRIGALLCLLALTAVFLPARAATVVSDEDAGHWLYENGALRVEIDRRTDPDVPLIWYEADLQTTADAPLATALSAEKVPQRHMKKPDTIARAQGMIYAQTDDFFGDRIGSRKLHVGVVIRNGALLYDDRGRGRSFPPLDTMALFPDGSMKVFGAKEHTAAEYQAMGVTDVLSFGPILIRNGEIDPRLDGGYADKEPRSALGMIAPRHYFAIVVEGRHKGSRGCGLLRIAQRMKEVGVTEALNLDGGQTAAMIFQGVQLNLTGRYKRHESVRSVTGVLGIRDAE